MNSSKSKKTSSSLSELSSLFYAYPALLKPRIKKIFGYPWCVLVGSIIATGGYPPLFRTLLTIISMFAIATVVYLYNDVVDLEMDRLNPSKKNRPLISGRVSVKETLIIIYINSIIGILSILYIGGLTGILLLAFFILFISYSHPSIRLKGRFPLKELTISTGGILSALIGGTIIGTLSYAVVFFSFIIFGFTYLAMPVFEDVTDVYEDEKYHVKTLAMVLRWRDRVMLFAGFLFTLMIVTPLTWVQLKLNLLFPIIVVGSCLVLLRYLLPLSEGMEEIKFNTAYKVLYGFWMFIFIAFILGSYKF